MCIIHINHEDINTLQDRVNSDSQLFPERLPSKPRGSGLEL